METDASHNGNFCFKSHPNDSEQKLTKARTQLLLNQPFFGTLCVRLKPVPGPVSTMATNGRVIMYNPEFVERLTAAELEAVVAHETLHCALGHHCRRGERDPELWNEAADLAINPILVANKFTLPVWGAARPRIPESECRRNLCAPAAGKLRSERA